jgi:thiamine pyrophosphate-dependent acetolactate synthase large subunit-like protein
MDRSKKILAGRRNFLKSAVAGAATLAAAPAVTKAQQPAPPRSGTAVVLAKEEDPGPISSVDILTNDRPGSDFMVDVIKALGFEYICANPGASFRGLHESLVNYGGNKSPEFITCCHEESSVAMAHGYAKVEGKPLLVLAHGTVGLQHAAMAVYNAFCDRVPIFMIVGNTIDVTQRRPGVEWEHCVQDGAALVRDFTKWDDLPISLPHFAESAMRAYKIAMTPPMAPVLLVADSDLQETPVENGAKLTIPKPVMTAPPQGDSGAVAEAAKMLVAAENPVLIAERAARTEAGMKLLVELAETLQAPVISLGARMSFPSHHPLSQTGGGLVSNADVILGLEVGDFWGVVNSYRDQLHRSSKPIIKPGTKLISITALDLYIKSNYQDFERYTPVDLAMAADAEATLPALIEACKRLLTSDRKRAIEERGKKLAAAHENGMERARAEAAYGWDSSPISPGRLYAEIWAQIKDRDWSLVSGEHAQPRLWNFDKFYRSIGSSGGSGVGYNAPASAGAALANRKHGRLSVNIQNDGDLMYAPGILWTTAHHQIPLLSIMNNNRAYHQEVMHFQRMACRHQRGITNAAIGSTLQDPNIEYAQLAKSLGVHGEGPITDPKDLGPAIARAIEVVQHGEPALVDVVTQPR